VNGNNPSTTGGFSRCTAICEAPAMLKRSALLPCLLGLAAAHPLHAESWKLDPVHTQVRFGVDHLGFSRTMGLFSIGQGNLQFDPEHWEDATLEVSINLDSLWLGDAKWQDTVKSWQFLQVKKWPQARYVSRKVEKTDAQNGVIHGELTLHGRTVPVDVAFHVNKIGNDKYTFKHTAGFAATASFKRSAFGMDKLLSAVGDDITLDIAVEAQRGEGAAMPAAPTPSDDEDHDDLAQ
jgi:polyisoprenoid-binding protein YceI